MRFGRVIILAGLAPLLSLSVVAAVVSTTAQPAEQAQPGKRTLVDFLRSVAILVTPAESATVSNASPQASPQAVLALHALAATPLRHSLWMLASAAAATLPARLPQRAPLRC